MGHLLLPDFLAPQNTPASPESIKPRPRDCHFSLTEADAKPCPAAFTTAALHAGLVQSGSAALLSARRYQAPGAQML